MDYNFKSDTTQEKQSTSASTSASKKLLKEFDQKPTDSLTAVAPQSHFYQTKNRFST